MRIATIMSLGVLAVSGAAVAQVATGQTAPQTVEDNTMAADNTATPDATATTPDATAADLWAPPADDSATTPDAADDTGSTTDDTTAQ